VPGRRELLHDREGEQGHDVIHAAAVAQELVHGCLQFDERGIVGLIAEHRHDLLEWREGQQLEQRVQCRDGCRRGECRHVTTLLQVAQRNADDRADLAVTA
jgi:hypothetical protein